MPADSFKTNNITVLLVDDQAIIGEVIRRMLMGEQDITFHFCQNPQEAQTIALQCSPTVILQDLVMPDTDGLEMVRLFKTDPATQNIPIIVLSGKEDSEAKAQSLEAGASDYLVKIPKKLELIASIRLQSQNYIDLLERNNA